MMLHIDGSHHRWFQDDRWYDLIVILDDATSEIYYAQLVEDEATRSVMGAIRHVVENQGWFASIYSDRAGTLESLADHEAIAEALADGDRAEAARRNAEHQLAPLWRRAGRDGDAGAHPVSS